MNCFRHDEKLGTPPRLLSSVGKVEDSLEIWKRVATPDVVDDDLRSLVECNGRLGRDADVLDLCRQARLAGAHDAFLLQWEVSLLIRYDVSAAISLVREVLARDSTRSSWRITLATLALRSGDETTAREQVPHLPTVSDVTAEQGAAVVQILRRLGLHVDALEYSYDLLRRFFDDVNAHRAFRDDVLERIGSAEDNEPTPQSVGPGVAVLIEEEDGGSERWFVLEDSLVQGNNVPDEFRPTAPICLKLTGGRVGDQVSLSDSPGLSRNVRIKEILPKRVFRIRDVWNNWQLRFVEHPELWVKHISPDAEGADQGSRFNWLIEMLTQRRLHIEEAEKLYRDRALPVHAMARLLNQSDIIAFGHVANARSLSLKCAGGSESEYEAAADAANAATELVLDIYGATTLMLLELQFPIAGLEKRVVVTNMTMMQLIDFRDSCRRRSGSSLSLADNPHGPPLHLIESGQEEDVASARVTAFVQSVIEHCTVVPCPELARLPLSDRNELLEILGPSALESMIAGASDGRVLWTDDGVVAAIGREKFGTRRTWTQALFMTSNNQGLMSDELYVRVAARLLGWQYSFTSVSSNVLREAGRQAEWNAQRAPLRQALDYFALPDLDAAGAAVLAARFVAISAAEVTLPETRQQLMQEVLESLAKRRSPDQVLEYFGRALRHSFGLNVIAERTAAEIFISWCAAFRRRLVG